MNVRMIEEILRWASQSGISDVALLGGEPTLHRNFVQIAKLPRAYGFNSVRLVTNGNKRFQRIISSIAEWIDCCYVSMDAPIARANDKIRGRGAFDDALRSIELLTFLGLPIVVNCTVSVENYNFMKQMIVFVENIGANRLNFHWLSPIGRARNEGISVSAHTWLELCTLVRDYRPTNKGFTVDIQKSFQKLNSALDNKEERTSCLVRNAGNLQFMPDGRVISCGLLADDYLLHGYYWRQGALWKRNGHTECSICAPAKSDGCPVRMAGLLNESEFEGFAPICIYRRTEGGLVAFE